ncbi:MAG: tetratricopeptide repeat protein [Polyangiaceae bacterium]
MRVSRPRWSRPWWLLVVSLGLSPFVAPTLALADGPSAADRESARKLAGEALDLFAAGDHQAAYDKFAEADRLVPAPTLKLRMARCLDKLDRLKEAVETYREIIAFELPRGAPAVHRQARKDAVPELAALLEQVPNVVVTVKGRATDGVTVTMDGEPFPSEQLGSDRAVDPGVHRFEARLGDRVATESVELARGDDKRVALSLPEPLVVGPVAGPGDRAEGGDGMRVAGWTFVALGGAGLVVGAATGGAVLAKEGGLEERCPNRACPPEAHADAAEFDRLRVTTTIALVVGGVSAGIGTTLLLTDAFGGDDEAASSAVAVTPFLGPLSAGVRGTFW